ncbi:MAG: tetratricopeptide repeat protein [Bacteroidales bacterium]|nr:tetratricopeptide repeat protein [Bacteroidales bacterium]
MKAKVLLLMVTVGMLFSTVTFAQDGEVDDFTINMSTYTEFYNQKNYRDAYPTWKWCFDNCDDKVDRKTTKNVFIQGPTILENIIATREGDAREAAIDTLLMIYDKRIRLYGQEATYLGSKAIMLNKYRPQNGASVYDMCTRVFELAGNSANYGVLKLYMIVALNRYEKEEISKETMVNVYSSISDALAEQAEKETKEDKKVKIADAATAVEELFVNSSAADCKSIIDVFTPKFEADPTNVELAKKIVKLLRNGNSDECKLSDLYMRTAIVMYENEKSSAAAHAIGQAYFKRGESGKAEQYYNEAISLEESNEKKADMYYELGLLYFTGMNNYAKARQAARSALAVDPNYGKAYLLIGRVYAAGGKGCGNDAFENKWVYWVVVDQFQKAKSVDPSVTEEANKLISTYSAYFPKASDAFWADMKEGATVTVGCWINETTTARFIN